MPAVPSAATSCRYLGVELGGWRRAFGGGRGMPKALS